MIRNIQVIDLEQIPFLTKNIQEFLELINNQTQLDSLVQSDNHFQQSLGPSIKVAHQNINKIKNITMNFAELLFLCFRTIEDLHDRNANLFEKNQKLREQIQELSVINQDLIEVQIFVREQANQKISNFQAIINQLQKQKKSIQDKYMQFQRQQILKFQQLLQKQIKIRQIYQIQLIKINDQNQQLKYSNQKLKRQIQELNKNIETYNYITKSTLDDQTAIYLQQDAKCFNFTQKQVQDIQFQEESCKSKLKKAQSLFFDIDHRSNQFFTNPQDRPNKLSTQQNTFKTKIKKLKPILDDSFKKSQMQRMNYIKKTIYKNSHDFKKSKKNDNDNSTLKKIYTFLHQNIVQKKIIKGKKN